MSSSRAIIYKASAGSGKTYTIVQIFLEILKRNPDSYKNILAVTFTNNVAAEMKDRIVEGLKKNAIESILFKNILQEILKNYDDFSVQTIDSFIQNSISNILKSNHPQENYTVVLDSLFILKRVFKKFILENKNPEVIDNIVTFCEKMLLEGRSWNLERVLFPLFNSFHLAINSSSEKFELNNFRNLRDKKENFSKLISDFEEKIISISKDILQKIVLKDLKIEDFAYGLTGVVGYINKLSFGNISLPGKRFKGALGGAEYWFSKKSPKEEYHDFVNEELIPMALELSAFLEEGFFEYLSISFGLQNIFLLEILIEIYSDFKDYLDKNNIVLLSENSNLFNNFSENDFRFLEKSKIEYNKFFIDEFQDISSSQWRCFERILQMNIAKKKTDVSREIEEEVGGDLFVVGDPKQSIYRWRGSNSNLMSRSSFSSFESVIEEKLDTNWRSLPNITIFNNFFFHEAERAITKELSKKIEAIERLEDKLILRKDLQKIEDIYKDGSQKPKPNFGDNLGYIEIIFLKFSEDKNKKHSRWEEAMLESIEKYEEVQKEGFSPKDIVFLVRNNKEAEELFMKIKERESSIESKEYCNYSVVAKASLRLKRDKTIKFILDVLEYLIENESPSQLYEISLMYENWKENSRKEWIEQQLKKLKKNKKSLILTIESIVNIFELRDDKSMKFLEKFFDVVREWMGKNVGDKEFLAWWQNESGEIFLSLEGEEFAQILTIHQAKGLQYDIVIIPNFDWHLDHSTQSAPILWSRHTKDEKLKNMPIVYSKNLAETDFALDYFLEKTDSYLDNLNLMYVSLTRAKERMYIISAPKLEEEIDSVGSLFFNIANSLEKTKSNFDAFRYSEEKIIIGEKFSRDKKSERKDLLDEKKGIEIFYNETDILEKCTISQKKAAQKGTRMHSQFEKIRILDYCNNINESITKDFPSSASFYKIGYELQTKLNDFHKQNECIEISEQSILSENGRIIRLDKLLIMKDKIVFLDLKTESLKQDHSAQMKNYKSVLGEIFCDREVFFEIIDL